MAINSIANLTDSTVAGSNTEIQYNNSGVFGASSNLTFNGTDELQLTDNTKLTLGTGNDADIYYDGTNLVLEPQVVGSGAVVINDAANVFVNDTANGSMTTGLTINQGANDDQILALKSSDVAHGLTSVVGETDTYFAITKQTGTEGGVIFFSANETTNHIGMQMQAYAGDPPTTVNSSSTGFYHIYGARHDGSNVVACSENAVAYAFRCRNASNSDSTLMVIDEDGDVSVNGSSTLGTFDTEVDYQLVRSARDVMMPTSMHTHTREMVEKHGDLLERNRIVFRNRDTDGVPYVNLKRGLFLAWDGIYQTGKKVYEEIEPKLQELQDELNKRDERIALLESRLNLLES